MTSLRSVMPAPRRGWPGRRRSRRSAVRGRRRPRDRPRWPVRRPRVSAAASALSSPDGALLADATGAVDGATDASRDRPIAAACSRWASRIAVSVLGLVGRPGDRLVVAAGQVEGLARHRPQPVGVLGSGRFRVVRAEDRTSGRQTAGRQSHGSQDSGRQHGTAGVRTHRHSQHHLRNGPVVGAPRGRRPLPRVRLLGEPLADYVRAAYRRDNRRAPAMAQGHGRGGGRRAGARGAGAPRAGTSRTAEPRRRLSGDSGGRSGSGPNRARLREVIEPVVAAAGYDVEGLSVSRAGRRHLVRLTVDARRRGEPRRRGRGVSAGVRRARRGRGRRRGTVRGRVRAAGQLARRRPAAHPAAALAAQRRPAGAGARR